MFKEIIRSITPPIIGQVFRKIVPHKTDDFWHGDFSSWDQAKKLCTGYDDPLILETTKNAILKVKNGDAASERDSVLFDEVQYNWPLATHLLKIAIENNNQLNLIDFGGSLGSSYFQNKNLIPNNVNFTWSVVEQSKYIDVGNDLIADDRLKFFHTIDDVCKTIMPQALLLSSVLQYLDSPYEFLNKIMSYKFRYIILDRTAFIDAPKDRITIQKVPSSIYDASYPAWFLSNKKLKDYFAKHYTIIYEFDNDFDTPYILDDQITAYWKGYLLKYNEQ